jgi:hypothetical protein
LRRDWADLAVETGLSPTRLAQMAVRAIDDPEVIAAHPVECRLLADRRDTARAERTA